MTEKSNSPLPYVQSVFTPGLAKHTKGFDLVDTLSVGVDCLQRNFESMQRQSSLSGRLKFDAQAKLIFYSALVDGKLEAPKSLLPDAHRLSGTPAAEVQSAIS